MNWFLVQVILHEMKLNECTKNGIWGIYGTSGVVEWHALGYTRLFGSHKGCKE